MIPDRGLGIVILCNRGKVPATRIGRQILLALAHGGEPAIEDDLMGDELRVAQRFPRIGSAHGHRSHKRRLAHPEIILGMPCLTAGIRILYVYGQEAYNYRFRRRL